MLKCMLELDMYFKTTGFHGMTLNFHMRLALINRYLQWQSSKIYDSAKFYTGRIITLHCIFISVFFHYINHNILLGALDL